MLTKAIIVGKILNTNKYTIRLPLLETAANQDPFLIEATLCTSDGVVDPFAVGDVVYVGFEHNEMYKPVILGKLSKVGLLDADNMISTGYKMTTLEVTGKTILPKDIQIGDYSYDKFDEIWNKVSNLPDTVEDLVTLNTDQTIIAKKLFTQRPAVLTEVSGETIEDEVVVKSDLPEEGLVASVNGKSGIVVLDYSDVGAVAANNPITGSSKCKITYDSKGLVTSGADLVASDLPTNYGDDNNPYASKQANYVLASPSGSAGVPSFRILVSDDIPTLSISKITDLQSTLNEKYVKPSGGIPDGDLAEDYVIANSGITGDTKCKITYDSKGLVTSGDDLSASDIPDLGSTYLKLSGGSTSISFNSNNLPQFSGSPAYLVGIEAFADNGTLKWQSCSNINISSFNNDSGYITSYDNYYPVRSYTSGLQISSYSGSTDCKLYVPYASSSQIGAVRVAGGTGISTSYSSGVCTVSTSNTLYIKTYWIRASSSSNDIQIRLALTTYNSSLYNGSTTDVITGAISNISSITGGNDTMCNGYWNGRGAIQQIRAYQQAGTWYIEFYYVTTSGGWSSTTISANDVSYVSSSRKAQ